MLKLKFWREENIAVATLESKKNSEYLQLRKRLSRSNKFPAIKYYLLHLESVSVLKIKTVFRRKIICTISKSSSTIVARLLTMLNNCYQNR